MEKGCRSCEFISEFERGLDARADALTARVNSELSEVRARNRERWDNFAWWVNLPVVGGLIYEVFRGPNGLENEPSYGSFDWYQDEGREIQNQAVRLESMKRDHLAHWGDELVVPGLHDDPAGYYTPIGKIRRADVYDLEFTRIMKNECAEREGVLRDSTSPCETYFVHIPDKYDFGSLAGVRKMQEGSYVLDRGSKKVVPLSECSIRWTALIDVASSPIERLVRRFFTRTGCVYSHGG